MAQDSRRRNTIIIVIVVLLIIALLLLLTRCLPEKSPSPDRTTPAAQPGTVVSSGANIPATTHPAEVLTPATLTAPERVTAGAAFSVTWAGPDNRGDYVTIVRHNASNTDYGHYQQTEHGKSLELTAPMNSGPHELRYVSGHSHTILGRTPIEVVAAGATVDGPTEVTLGAPFSVSWTGPNNRGDYITIVAKDAPDAHYGSYADANKPSPQTLTAPTVAGDAELRYVTGQDKKVLARRPIQVVMADVTLSAPAEAIAGSTIAVTWTGPNNSGDYITVVSAETPDGQYGNYTVTSSGSPLDLLMPIMAGEAELRYMTGQGNRVLARRAIKMVAAEVTLSAAAEGRAGSAVSVTWTGPNNSGDYITIVARSTPDGQYADYTLTNEGSPLNVNAPKEAGDAEIRYMTGQGNKVLARIPIKIAS